jgi:mannitol/fructose-specific phosphotransferase system IIA component (Ntr-type)
MRGTIEIAMPATVDFTELLRADDVHLRFQSPSVVEAIPLLLRPALERRVHNRDISEAIIDAAVKREEDTPTRCGPLSLPHARSSSVADFILALGANATGVIAGRPEPRLMFAFVSPEDRRDQHLQLLAKLAKLSQNEGIVEKIAGANSGKDVLEILRSAI